MAKAEPMYAIIFGAGVVADEKPAVEKVTAAFTEALEAMGVTMHSSRTEVKLIEIVAEVETGEPTC